MAERLRTRRPAGHPSRRRWALPAVVLLAVAAVGAGTTGAQASSDERGHWLLDETSGTVAHDASGRGNHGAVVDVVGDGTGYSFNGTSSRVVVPDDASLDPGSASFSFGATLVVGALPDLDETYDALRKGLTSTKGGNYKLEIKNVKGFAVARCLVKDSLKVVAAVQSPASRTRDLDDGKPHTLVCVKTGTGVTLHVDGHPPRTKAVTRLGSVANAADLALGAKAETTASTGFDWFDGRIDDAWVSVAG